MMPSFLMGFLFMFGTVTAHWILTQKGILPELFKADRWTPGRVFSFLLYTWFIAYGLMIMFSIGGWDALAVCYLVAAIAVLSSLRNPSWV